MDNIKITKRDPTDVIVFVIFMFIMAVGFIVYWYFTTTTAAALSASPINSTETAPAIQALSDLGTRGSGEAFLFIMGAMVLGTMLTSFLVREHPAFIVIYIIMLIATVVLAAFLGNAYASITSQPPFDNMATTQPIIDVMMRHILLISVVVGVLSMIISMSKLFGHGGSTV